MTAPQGQPKPGTLTSRPTNPKRQPGSASVASGLDGDGVSDHYPQKASTNLTDRGRPQNNDQNDRGYVQETGAGTPATQNTSAGRVRNIPNP